MSTEGTLDLYPPLLQGKVLMSLSISRPRALSEGFITAVAVSLLVLASTILSLRLTAPQLSWDEADYALVAKRDWRTLPYTSSHNHGPLMLYCIKLSSEATRWLTSIEDQPRLLLALMGSLAVGVTYWGLRHVFATSRLGALAGANLLLLSVIRLRETNILGPHYPLLLWTLLVCILGYLWRHTPTLSAALVLGTVFGVAASTTDYCIPLALCWGAAMVVMRAKWLEYDRIHLWMPWTTLLLLSTAVIVVSVLWPPSVRHLALLDNFRFHVANARVDHFTLVDHEFLKQPPSTTYFYWLWHLDAPILFFGLLGLASSVYQAFRRRAVTSKQRLLLLFLGVLCATALAAQNGGPRNLLPVVGVVCLFAGVTCDAFMQHHKWRKVLFACLVMTWPILNLVAVQMREGEIPYLFWNGYRSFVEQNQGRLSQPNAAYIDGIPMLRYYAERSAVSVEWEMSELPWRSWEPLPPDAKYALISEVNYRYLPLEHPARSVIDRNWKVVWSFKEPGTWGLRLYERP